MISSVKSGVAKAILSNGSISESILEYMVTGIGVRPEKAYQYAKSSYTYGLPSSVLLKDNDGLPAVFAELSRIKGESVVIDYYHFGALNLLHFGWIKLSNDYGYSSKTNELTVLSLAKGTPVYLVDMVVVINKLTNEELLNGSVEQWGTPPSAGYTPKRLSGLGEYAPHSAITTNSGIANDYLDVHFNWEVTTTVIVEGVSVTRKTLEKSSMAIPVAGYSLASDYFQVGYTSTTGRGYWLYAIGAGTYPKVDAAFTSAPTNLGSFFPFAYFRLSKSSMDNYKTTDAYKTTEQMLKKLGMNYANTIKAINENPDIADVEQALLTMAVPANSTNSIEQKYLFDFFKKLFFEAGSAGIGDASNLTLPNRRGNFPGEPVKPKVSVVIQDKRFKMALSSAGIFRQVKYGIVCGVGKHTSKVSSINILQTSYNRTLKRDDVFSVAVPIHVYQMQVTETLYEEISVHALSMTYYILDYYTTVGTALDPILLLPLDYAITSQYTIAEREELYARSLHYVFNSSVTTKLKWYEQKSFGTFVKFAGIFISIATLNPAALAATTITTTAIALLILDNIVIPYILAAVVFPLFVKLLGVDAAMLAAFMAIAYAVTAGIKAGSLAGAPWAKVMLSVANGLTDAITESISSSIQEISNEMAEFSKYADAKFTELASTKALLETNNYMIPMLKLGQTPDEFYNTAVHAGNPGPLTITAISSYVSLALTLPKISDTLGDTYYGN